MKLKTKLLSLAMTGVMALGFTACSVTASPMKIDGQEIPAGVYLAYLSGAYSEALNLVEDSTKSVFDQTVEEKNGEEWIRERALTACKEFVAIANEFEERGLTLSEEDSETITTQNNASWDQYGSFYEQNGTGKESLRKITENNVKAQKIFKEIYGDGGEKEVPLKDVREYFVENYAKTEYIAIPLTGSDGEAVSEDEKKELQEQIDEYYDRVKGGEDFTKVIAEYQKERQGDDYVALEEGEDYSTVIAKNNTSIPEDFIEKLFDAKYDDLQKFSDDNYLYLFCRYDAVEDEEELEANKDAIISEMKTDEFNEEIANWAKDLEVETDDSVLSKYSPRNIKQ